ncbi:MAG: D-alanine--D-alanine ligase [Deltaproteobacteria bacterium]|nr:D-alanine--D-alanine ligase [Deltaproteobacteria bacterium]MBW1947530.1 D-alanine--D-alanine ligase [Deltaproteobacteria bacterium]MBW2097575.1 D-alanine--D-alanine ligase [Deltaproteobacteria bacterium]
MSEKNKIRLALLCGGHSAEREISIAGAREVERALDPGRYHIMRYDPATDLDRLIRDRSHLDVAFILLHGRYGEDGTIQGLLELIGLPYQGSGVLGSALAMDKHLAKVIYQEAEIPTAPWIHLHRSNKVNTKEIVSRLGLPLMVKPCTQGSSVGIIRVAGEDKLGPAIKEAFRWDDRILAESFIKGREITGGILGLDDLLPLPVVEIIPGSGHSFFDYDAKYLPGATKEICPADIPGQVSEKAQALAVAAHRALQLRAYSRTDMILADTGKIFVLETNTIPGMTQTSLFPQAAEAAGIPFSRLLDQLIDMALSGTV